MLTHCRFESRVYGCGLVFERLLFMLTNLLVTTSKSEAGMNEHVKRKGEFETPPGFTSRTNQGRELILSAQPITTSAVFIFVDQRGERASLSHIHPSQLKDAKSSEEIYQRLCAEKTWAYRGKEKAGRTFCFYRDEPFDPADPMWPTLANRLGVKLPPKKDGSRAPTVSAATVFEGLMEVHEAPSPEKYSNALDSLMHVSSDTQSHPLSLVWEDQFIIENIEKFFELATKEGVKPVEEKESSWKQGKGYVTLLLKLLKQ
ncbi:hypothetical protein PROFUN_12921 [Planoprotostelium fungivorum]|uniref:Nudix hydrolase domain-containing protein n=1 Tax=Planoprotostelium fungivorum TaxID=1890364 RepID=A0A2P6N5Z4_9EUKA|nr:hypothetical protein PROFUN_12921 [Planoprotostelium fungivorum]